jgi:hypothetical protein
MKDVSKEYIASIFRDESQPSKKLTWSSQASPLYISVCFDHQQVKNITQDTIQATASSVNLIWKFARILLLLLISGNIVFEVRIRLVDVYKNRIINTCIIFCVVISPPDINQNILKFWSGIALISRIKFRRLYGTTFTSDSKRLLRCGWKQCVPLHSAHGTEKYLFVEKFPSCLLLFYEIWKCIMHAIYSLYLKSASFHPFAQM